MRCVGVKPVVKHTTADLGSCSACFIRCEIRSPGSSIGFAHRHEHPKPRALTSQALHPAVPAVQNPAPPRHCQALYKCCCKSQHTIMAIFLLLVSEPTAHRWTRSIGLPALRRPGLLSEWGLCSFNRSVDRRAEPRHPIGALLSKRRPTCHSDIRTPTACGSGGGWLRSIAGKHDQIETE